MEPKAPTVREILLEEISRGGTKEEIMQRSKTRLPGRSATTFHIQYAKILKANKKAMETV